MAMLPQEIAKAPMTLIAFDLIHHTRKSFTGGSLSHRQTRKPLSVSAARVMLVLDEVGECLLFLFLKFFKVTEQKKAMPG